ncbi:MAG: hypothetical protein M3N52_11970 [Actinomycetota bacterium]|nr:hypothetical protein [Actinomycetota bacterium]
MNRWEFEQAVASSGLLPRQRLVLLVLAALADWPGGRVPAKYSPSLSSLAIMCGLGRSTVARALNDVEAARWVSRRRPVSAKALAAHDKTHYRLSIPASLRAGRGLVPQRDGSSPTTGRGVVPQRDGTSPTVGHSPYQDPSSGSGSTVTAGLPGARGTSPERMVAEATGATDAEAAAIVNRVRNERNPRSLVGLLRTMAIGGDLAGLLTEQRAAVRLAEVDAKWREIRTGPECEHREPGGLLPHPTTGQPVCPLCRRKGAGVTGGTNGARTGVHGAAGGLK